MRRIPSSPSLYGTLLRNPSVAGIASPSPDSQTIHLDQHRRPNPNLNKSTDDETNIGDALHPCRFRHAGLPRRPLLRRRRNWKSSTEQTSPTPRITYATEQVKSACDEVSAGGSLQVSVQGTDGADKLKPEGFRLKSLAGDTVEVVGADQSGVLYGCLELAERIRAAKAIPADLDLTDAPEFKLRGPCIGMQKLLDPTAAITTGPTRRRTSRSSTTRSTGGSISISWSASA